MKENENFENKRGSNRWLIGLLLLLVGLVLFGQRLDLIFLPEWIFSWPVILIIVGFFMGIKNNFESWPWALLIILGTIFLINDQIPEWDISRFTWPIILVTIGFVIMVRPSSCRRQRIRRGFAPPPPPTGHSAAADPFAKTSVEEAEVISEKPQPDSIFSDEEIINVNSVFGGSKRNIFSKNFKGGEVNCFMGGAEIDLSKADINGVVVLEANQVFGGTKLIVPSHWLIKNEITAVFGGVDDKRHIREVNTDNSKVLILKGFALFGGMEINSYSY